MTNKIKITSPADAFRLDLEHGSRFTTAGKLHGGPVPGIGEMDRGILPEKYWDDAKNAVYAVFHYETPIIWKAKSGTWYVPMHSYSTTTSRFRNRMIEAIKSFDGHIEEI